MSLSERRRKLVGRLRRRKTREREGLFLVEGTRTVAEALAAEARCRFAVSSPRLQAQPLGVWLLERLDAAGVDVVEADDDSLGELSDTDTPQGILLVCEEPGWSLDNLEAGPGARFLVLDAIQDPGNLGTLVRAAAAFALSGVLALDGTVDPWNPKAVRASAGGIFHIPVLCAPWGEVEGWLDRSGVALLAAEAGGVDVATVEPGDRWALAIGNEGAGVREGLAERAPVRVGVPMPGGLESLNAGMAGSILLYALSADLRRSPGGEPSGGGRPSV